MRIFKHPILFGGLKHLRQVFWLSIMNILPVPGTLRWIFAKWGGVNFISDNEKKWFYIGSNVRFDRVYPGNIIIHNGVHITHGVIFLTHCLAYIIHSGFISGYQNRYGDNLKPPTNVYHRMTA